MKNSTYNLSTPDFFSILLYPGLSLFSPIYLTFIVSSLSWKIGSASYLFFSQLFELVKPGTVTVYLIITSFAVLLTVLPLLSVAVILYKYTPADKSPLSQAPPAGISLYPASSVPASIVSTSRPEMVNIFSFTSADFVNLNVNTVEFVIGFG